MARLGIALLLVLLCLQATCGQLHHLRLNDRFKSHPGDRISFVDVSESEGELPAGDNATAPGTAPGGEAVAGLAGSPPASQLKSSMDDVESSINTVQTMMNQVAQQIAEARKKKVVAEQKKAEIQQQKELEDFNMREKRARQMIKEKRRRFEIERCLAAVRGGADKIYYQLRSLMAKTPTAFVCPVLKAYEFPNLVRHGFNERIAPHHNITAGDTSGATALFFKAAKPRLFQCICEDKLSKKRPFVRPNVVSPVEKMEAETLSAKLQERVRPTTSNPIPNQIM